MWLSGTKFSVLGVSGPDSVTMPPDSATAAKQGVTLVSSSRTRGAVLDLETRRPVDRGEGLRDAQTLAARCTEADETRDLGADLGERRDARQRGRLLEHLGDEALDDVAVEGRPRAAARQRHDRVAARPGASERLADAGQHASRVHHWRLTLMAALPCARSRPAGRCGPAARAGRACRSSRRPAAASDSAPRRRPNALSSGMPMRIARW